MQTPETPRTSWRAPITLDVLVWDPRQRDAAERALGRLYIEDGPIRLVPPLDGEAVRMAFDTTVRARPVGLLWDIETAIDGFETAIDGFDSGSSGGRIDTETTQLDTSTRIWAMAPQWVLDALGLEAPHIHRGGN